MRTLIYSIIALAWLVASYFANLNDFFLPDAIGLLAAIFTTSLIPDTLGHIGITFGRVLLGSMIAVLVGLPLGLWMAKSDPVRELLEPIFDFMRGIPVAMLFPLFIVFVGFGELSRALIVVTLSLPIIIISVMVASRPNSDNEERLAYFRLRQQLLSRKTKVRMMLWEALPGVITGLRIALSLGLVVVIVTEMFFVASSGIGWLAYRAYEGFQIDALYFYILIAGLISIAVNIVINRIRI
ncbi:ABC transporter permease [Qipengyuania sp. ASV99]|uniref:ABC transporter permease n=1 Tax=Qipengyuania sp. ASV99 TaxID=3399681 RepID=UPI003A4C6F20